MLAGVAELLAIDPELLDDLKTAVSEACNNVVLHAYGGEAGPMSVSLFIDAERIRVTVEDRGAGLPAAAPAEGIGLSVIRALAQDVALESPPEGGTRVQMEFAARRGADALLESPQSAGPELPLAADGRGGDHRLGIAGDAPRGRARAAGADPGRDRPLLPGSLLRRLPGHRHPGRTRRRERPPARASTRAWPPPSDGSS